MKLDLNGVWVKRWRKQNSRRHGGCERRALIHGARAVLFRVKYDAGAFGEWLKRLQKRRTRNVVT